MSGSYGPTVTLQMPFSSFCMSTGFACPSMLTWTLAALGELKRNVTCPSLDTSGETIGGGNCATTVKAEKTTNETSTARDFLIMPPANLSCVFVQKIERHENEKDDRNHAIHRKKCRIEFTQIVLGN